MNKFFKKSVTILVVTAIISLLMPTLVLADHYSDAYCPLLNKPAETKDWIITILEEEIGSSGSIDDGTGSLITNCYRVTTEKEIDKKKVQVSEYAATCDPTKEKTLCQRVQVLIAKSGAGLLYMYIGLIYKWAAGVIGVISVLYMVWGGIQISAAGDNAGKIDEAKQKILQSIAGLILLFMSAVILYTINPNFFTA